MREWVLAIVLGFLIVGTAKADEQHAGSAYIQQQRIEYCTGWAIFAWKTHGALREKVSSRQLIEAIAVLGELSGSSLDDLTRVVTHTYIWTDTSESLRSEVMTWCMQGWQLPQKEPESDPESHSFSEPVGVRVKGQPMHCSNEVEKAVDMIYGATGFRNSEFRPENYHNAADRETAQQAWACKDVPIEQVRACVLRKCMEQRT